MGQLVATYLARLIATACSAVLSSGPWFEQGQDISEACERLATHFDVEEFGEVSNISVSNVPPWHQGTRWTVFKVNSEKFDSSAAA